MTITITLAQILNAKPCYNPYTYGLVPTGHDLNAPIRFCDLVNKVRYRNDVVWCFSIALSGYELLKRHFAVDCAERFKHLLTDEHSLNAITTARRYALGEVTNEELTNAFTNASTAACTARYIAIKERKYILPALAAEIACYTTLSNAGNAAWRATRMALIADTEEVEWQVKRIIQITETGKWMPIEVINT